VRYIYLLILVFIMSVTWSWVQNDQNVPELIHAEIQEDLQELISNSIKKQMPNSKNIEFKNVWSETLEEGKVKVHFDYSFDDSADSADSAGIALKGYAILKRQPSDDNRTELWASEKIQISNNHITFKEGLTFTQDSLDEEETDENDPNVNVPGEDSAPIGDN